MKNKFLFFWVVAICMPISAMAQLSIGDKGNNRKAFPIVTQSHSSVIYYDANDSELISVSASLLSSDIAAVTGKKIEVIPLENGEIQSNGDKQAIIIGTLGNSRIIDSMAKSGKIKVDDIRHSWERFVIEVVNNPFPGINRVLVIAGSDRRGTSYGVFTLSQAMGVSAWNWWADVPVVKHKSLYLNTPKYISKAPSVKYRGIFINDEDWGMKTWSSKNYEKDLNDIGPKTYERVCELILRLKGNMLAPAMHACTGAFYTHSQSKEVANKYGIIITTSHCEPLLFNNASTEEWDISRDWDWNYVTNKYTILKKLDDRVKEAAPFENIYTMGMRGLHDAGMRGDLSNEQKVNVLANVMDEQRNILQMRIGKEVSDIPQIFVPYKETLDIYELGLKVPDDITLVWPDDNYGYMKALSNPTERKRKGGSGVYYHTSYLGAPHDYLWLCTTPPVLMYEELKKAYSTGADRYWLLNVGDIKPAELDIQTFFEMAWDINCFNYDNVNRHQAEFLSSIFGVEYKSEFQNVLDNYYRLAWSRKPEYMGWEREWDELRFINIKDTEFSFSNYNDATQRLADYNKISSKVNKIAKSIPKSLRPSFFQLVEYPVKAASQMNYKFLMAQLNHELVKKGNIGGANWAASQSIQANDSIKALDNIYNSQLNGKWNHFMTQAPGFCSRYQNMPKLIYTEGIKEKPISILPVEYELNNCTVIDLQRFSMIDSKEGHTLRVLKGIGYDWTSIQLGEATEKVVDPSDLKSSKFVYEFSGMINDSLTVYVYTVPFFPLYKGMSNRFGISIDGQKPYISSNQPKEYSLSWKNQVLQNGTLTKVKFHVDNKLTKHTLSLICGDPGNIVQRVVLDWGGLKETYVGPQVKRNK